MDGQIAEVHVTVRRERVIDRQNRERIHALLMPVYGVKDEFTTRDLWNFVHLITTTEGITSVDFQLPDPDALFDELEAAWKKFCLLDAEVVDGWITLHNQVNESPNQRKFLPPDELTDAEKKSGQLSEVNTASG
jgi:hypothetical protein